MSQTTTGWIVFLAAIGMMLSLLAVDVSRLNSLNEVWSTTFISSLMAHLGTVITAFIGGKLIPTERDPSMRTRNEDKVTEAVINNIIKNEEKKNE